MDRIRQIAILSMALSAGLCVLKIVVGYQAGSAAVMADGFESATDVFSSFLVFVGVTLALRPADENHPYGHGRAETLTGLLLGFFLLLAGLAIAWHGLTGVADVTAPPAGWAIWPLLLAIGVKSTLALRKYRLGRKTGSMALVADATHDAIDMLSAIVALAALSITLYDPVRFLHADHYGACAVGVIVMATALRVMHEAAMQLMDTMPGDAEMAEIRRVALLVPDVSGVEKCFARKTGLKYHVDLHLEVDPDISVRASHEIATRVRIRIRETLPWVQDVLVHVEPWPGHH